MSDENIRLLLWQKLFLIVVHSHGRSEGIYVTVPRQVNSSYLYRTDGKWWQQESGHGFLYLLSISWIFEKLLLHSWCKKIEKQFSLNPKTSYSHAHSLSFCILN